MTTTETLLTILVIVQLLQLVNMTETGRRTWRGIGRAAEHARNWYRTTRTRKDVTQEVNA